MVAARSDFGFMFGSFLFKLLILLVLHEDSNLDPVLNKENIGARGSGAIPIAVIMATFLREITVASFFLTTPY
jgi:hypothetical protein